MIAGNYVIIQGLTDTSVDTWRLLPAKDSLSCALRKREVKYTDYVDDRDQNKTFWDVLEQEDYQLAEKMVAEGTDINIKDKDGDTPLHKSLKKRNDFVLSPLSLWGAPTLSAIVKELKENRQPAVDVKLAVACFLACKGANLEQKNFNGIAPFQLLDNTDELMELFLWSKKKGYFCERSTRSDEARHQPIKKTEEVSERTVEAQKCQSCRKQQSRIAFPCGHDACFSCAQSLVACYMCGMSILGRMATFETAKQKIREIHTN